MGFTISCNQIMRDFWISRYWSSPPKLGHRASFKFFTERSPSPESQTESSLGLCRLKRAEHCSDGCFLFFPVVAISDSTVPVVAELLS